MLGWIDDDVRIGQRFKPFPAAEQSGEVSPLFDAEIADERAKRRGGAHLVPGDHKMDVGSTKRGKGASQDIHALSWSLLAEKHDESFVAKVDPLSKTTLHDGSLELLEINRIGDDRNPLRRDT